MKVRPARAAQPDRLPVSPEARGVRPSRWQGTDGIRDQPGLSCSSMSTSAGDEETSGSEHEGSTPDEPEEGFAAWRVSREAAAEGLRQARAELARGGAGGRGSIVELRVNLTREAVDALHELAERQERTESETLQNAIALAFYIDQQVGEDGAVLVRRPDGELYELIFPWLRGMQSPRASRVVARRRRAPWFRRVRPH